VDDDAPDTTFAVTGTPMIVAPLNSVNVSAPAETGPLELLTVAETGTFCPAEPLNPNDVPIGAPAVLATLRERLADADLACVRDVKSLDSLPESERADWIELWDRVRQLVAATD
jgi:hypothetical protein